LEAHSAKSHSTTLAPVSNFGPNPKLHLIARELKKCPVCSFPVRDDKEFRIHASQFHRSCIEKSWKKCDDCSELFPIVGALQTHRQRVHRKDLTPVSCSFCQKRFSNRLKYYSHVNIEHLAEASEFWFHCNECRTFFPARKYLANHKRLYHKRVQAEVNQTDNSLTQIAAASHEEPVANWDTGIRDLLSPASETNSEIRNLSASSRKTLICPFCQFSTTAGKRFYSHVNNHHRDQAAALWFPCNYCGKFYPTKSVRYSHVYMSHTYKGQANRLPLNLPDLNGSGPNDQNFALELVEAITMDTRPTIESDQSNQATATEVHSPVALNTSDTEILRQPEPLPEQERPSDDAIMCYMCMTHFQTQNDYYHHANLKHREAISKKWHHCDTCLWFFPARKSLANHGCQSQSSSLGQIKCQFCAHCFDSKSTSDYIIHANKDHIKFLKKAGWVGCPVCLSFYPNQGSLDRHLLECKKDVDESAETEAENLDSLANKILDEVRAQQNTER